MLDRSGEGYGRGLVVAPVGMVSLGLLVLLVVGSGGGWTAGCRSGRLPRPKREQLTSEAGEAKGLVVDHGPDSGCADAHGSPIVVAARVRDLRGEHVPFRAEKYDPIRATEDVMLEPFRAAMLVAATIAMGLMAGVFGHYAHTVMPGLGRTDNRTFVGAFQAIDRAIINPWFLASFFGALVLTGLAVALHLGEGGRSVLPWTVAALVLYLVAFGITIGVNVPLNDGIKAAGDPDRIADLAAVRERFDEAKWVRWNLARAVVSTAALGCLTWALVLHGRIATGGGA